MGDLKTRTAESVIKLGSKFNMKIKLLNHELYPLTDDKLEEYSNHPNVSVKTIRNNQEFKKTLDKEDIIYYSNYYWYRFR